MIIVLADIAYVWHHERADLIKHFEAGEEISNFKSIVPLLQPDISFVVAKSSSLLIRAFTMTNEMNFVCGSQRSDGPHMQSPTYASQHVQ